MKTSRLSLRAMLIATSALIAPHMAFAQEADVDQEAAPQQEAQPEGEVIIVRGVNIPEPLRETSEVAAFLSTEDLERQSDSNAAEALTRVTGLTIAEDRFIYVRGLGERYSSAILNGSPLPSPEPLQRVVPLDLFPSSILENVLVQKTYSPEYPGEFGGGIIELSTLNLPKRPFFEAGLGIGYSSETTLDRGLTHFGSDGDPWGFDDETRKYPNAVRAATDTARRLSSANYSDAELQRIGRSFENAKLNLLQNNNDIPFNGSVDLSGGYTMDVGATRLGVVGVLGYSNDWETQQRREEEGFVENNVIVPRTFYDVLSTENKVGWDALFGAGVEFGEHRINWTNLYVRRTTKETSSREGFDELFGDDVRDDRTAWYERQLFSTQLAGEHGLGDFTVGWRAALAESRREAPYEKQIRYFFDDTTGMFLHDASRVRNGTGFSSLSDQVASAGVDIAYKLPLAGLPDPEFKFGVEHLDNSRSSESRLFRFVAQNQALPIAIQQQRVDFLLADFNIRPDRLVLVEATGADGAAAYDAQIEVTSAYAKVDAEIIPLVRTALGFRYERGLQSVNPRSLFLGEAAPSAAPKIKEEYFLPAATLTWNFFEEMQLRFGVSQTIGRPQFRELAPQQYLDPDSDRLFIGNPFLQNTEFLNFDARYEYYFGRQQYATVGLFYKDIDRPVESVVNDQGGTVSQTYLNAPKATLTGAEFEIKKIWEAPFASAWLASKNFLTQANYTYTTSEVQVGAGDVVFPLAGNGSPRPAQDFIIDGTRLQGQSEHVANLQVGWQDDELNEQATLIVTYASERSSARGRPGAPDFTQEPGVLMDFVYQRGFVIGGRDFSFSFKAANLLDEDFSEFQQLGGGHVDVNRYDLGQSVSLGLKAAF